MRKLIFFLFCAFDILLFAQSEIAPVRKNILGNNIAASVRSDGILFGDSTQGLFFTGDLINRSPIRSVGLWIGGADPGGNLKGAIQTYANQTNDFYPGFGNRPLGEFNHIWKIRKSEIDAHFRDFYRDSILQDTITAVFSWPGFGNPYFENYFDYPLSDTPNKLPSFWDNNGDNVYDVFGYDFPYFPDFQCNFPYPAEEMLWFPFHGGSIGTNNNSGFIPMRMDVSTSLYTLKCEESDHLANNTLFLRYKFFNNNTEDLDTCFIGLFMDFQLGCPNDDYFGVAPDSNVIFVYNSDNFDEDCGDFKGYGENPPAVGVKFYSKVRDNSIGNTVQLSKVMAISNDSTQTNQTMPSGPLEYYRYLSGSWKDGTPLTYGNSGYDLINPNPASFIYPSHPLDSSGWSELALGNEPGRRRILASLGPFKIQPGQVQELIVAFTFLKQEGFSNLENMQLAYDSLSNHLDDLFLGCINFGSTLPPWYHKCTRSSVNYYQNPADPSIKEIPLDFNLYPNPVQNWLNLEFTSIENLKTVEIYDALGRLVVTIPNLKEQIDIPVFDWERGIYFVVATTAEKRFAKSFLVMR